MGRGGTIGDGDIFDAGGRGGGKHERQAKLFSYRGDTRLGIGVEDGLDADGGDQDGRGHALIEEGGAEVTDGDGAEHSGDDLGLELVEGFEGGMQKMCHVFVRF